MNCNKVYIEAVLDHLQYCLTRGNIEAIHIIADFMYEAKAHILNGMKNVETLHLNVTDKNSESNNNVIL